MVHIISPGWFGWETSMTSRHLKGKLTPQHFYFMCASNFFHVDQITARIPVGLVAISRRRQHPLSIPVRADSCQRAQVCAHHAFGRLAKPHFSRTKLKAGYLFNKCGKSGRTLCLSVSCIFEIDTS